ncbi:exopolysaccharide biosynthesis polyprenyl glycosylphosphotransferase [Winogradskyella sp. A3E31]|uniref:exopolysaccharide biosynthesis polyprenyl glycosylphosphotransferase n=1 Tax=Winogradskyella sp. A3E31 TaxID=3349637 RepID=UPI00398AB7AC
MKKYVRGRYSWLLRPTLIVFDIVVINLLAIYCFKFHDAPIEDWYSIFAKYKSITFAIYISLFWLLSTYSIKFYNVYRYTSGFDVTILIIKQFLLFCILVFAFVGFFRSITISAYKVLEYVVYSFLLISAIKLISFYGLKHFRKFLNGNVRRVLIIGNGQEAQELQDFFTRKKDYGYSLLGVFSDVNSEKIDGTAKEGLEFLKKEEGVDEVYCAMEELTEQQVNAFVKQADSNNCNIKFIPKSKNLFEKHLKTDFYNYQPVLSLQEATLNAPFNQLLKRSFDIAFSLFVIVFILSWLSIILYILIKLESKGPLFYKHKRNGINYKEFECYKFRSLKKGTDKPLDYVQPKDERVTKIGAFLRRTSIDELPQFYNVLFGDMSVVGPRPHMVSFTEDYSKKIDKYNFLIRHNVKPGITGLAQTKGYRGEIKTDQDIVNRVKYDLYYIENWSILLDVKIIFQTIILLIKGDENAY